ncbi:class I SAM-dependent methyltransferase [Paenibacillus soyae]|uniref:Methyltransferase domain-containing protein n=1 Tax=Paenibacillus soyae TaxID=2969249 RepID=A0A9X2MMD3_9BACL|nr:methyltransferase domain-containing protein [Paenibacillus soyae]MCR2802769.1 methyltransferase domain-containing protein [Paenibacillus soyae]
MYRGEIGMTDVSRLERIRAEERAYHDECYARNELFAPGSWLQKPVATVMNLLPRLDRRSSLQMLDLGCGVGRNTIPMAQYIQKQGKSGQVAAVDLLESAINGLGRYAQQYEVASSIRPVLSDIESYKFEPHSFDLIVAVSTLEHLRSIPILKHKLNEMAAGTKPGGIVCIVMSSNIQEKRVATGESLDPMFEINLNTEALIQMLDDAFTGWTLLDRQVKALQFKIERRGEPVWLGSDCLTYVVQNPDL